MRVYLYLKFTDSVPDEHQMTPEEQWAFTRYVLVSRFHWTLDYVDELTDWQMREIFAIIAAENKEQADRSRK